MADFFGQKRAKELTITGLDALKLVVTNAAKKLVSLVSSGSPADYLGGDLLFHPTPLNHMEFWSNIGDALGGLFKVMDTDTAMPANNAYVVTAADQELQDWISPISGVGFDEIPQGNVIFHIHAKKNTGTADVFIYAKLYSRTNPAGVETLIGTSGNSSVLTTDTSEQSLSFALAAPVNLNINDRLLIKLYASKSGAGTNPTVTVYLGGTNDSRVSVQTNALDSQSSPTFAAVTLTGLSASQAVMTNADKKLVSTDYLDQAVKAASNPTFSDVTLTDLTASKVVGTDADKKLTSLDSTGTGNVVRATSPTIATPIISTPTEVNSTVIGGIKVTQLGAPTGLSVAVTGIGDGEQWYYRIVAVDVNGNRAIPTAEFGTDNGATWAHYNGTTNKNTVTWTAINGAVSYDIYRYTVPSGGTTGLIAAEVTGTSYVDDKAAGDNSQPNEADNTGSFSGVMSGEIPIYHLDQTTIIPVSACKGGFVFLISAEVHTLPLGFDKANLIIVVRDAIVVSLDPGNNDRFILNGLELDMGNKITSPGVSGDMVTLVNYSHRWFVLGVSTWTDGGP